MAAFYHGATASRPDRVGNILEPAPGISPGV
jgi:hypothetical protein